MLISGRFVPKMLMVPLQYMQRVRRNISARRLMLAGLGLLWIAAPVRISLADEANPYLSIVERNAFGLKDPPEPAPPAPPPPALEPPKPTVKLTGLTTLFNKKKALIELTEPGPGS
jgi:hypothetical protein